VSEAACVISDEESVTFYTEQLIARARCYEDKLNCRLLNHVFMASAGC